MSCGAKPAIIQMNEVNVEENLDSPNVGAGLEPSNVGEGLDPPGEANVGESLGSPDKTIFVHVCGAVVSPGVYEMIEGNRVFEAIEQAGGFTDEAHAQAINLADKVVDGQQVVVPTEEEATLSPQVPVGADESEQGLININTADQVRLQELSGIGEAKAKGILNYRESNGRFNSIEDIKSVSGIGDKLYEQIKENITVD